jgi:hypothetical protein
MTLGDLSKFIVIKVKKGLNSTTVTTVRPVVTDPLSRRSH